MRKMKRWSEGGSAVEQFVKAQTGVIASSGPRSAASPPPPPAAVFIHTLS